MIEEKKSVAVIGLGYVGLPLVIELSRFNKVCGFDTNKDRIQALNEFLDFSSELGSDDIKMAVSERGVVFTNSETDIEGFDFYIISVPTPVNEKFEPDLSLVKSASAVVGRAIKRGSIVIYESTVYPGATENDCIPVVSEVSGLKPSVDFFYGYSPERINPGDKTLSVRDIVKVTSGCCAESAEKINNLYDQFIPAGTFRASSVRVAEASKVFENVQRDVNIALVNEFSMLCHALDINTTDVLDAASTKWNFMRFMPGLVGGHCIGIDPYYLIHKAKEVDAPLDITMQAREINESIPQFVTETLKSKFISRGVPISGSAVLVMGYTFKENCSDVRNTKVQDIVNQLTSSGCQVDVFDPWVIEGQRELLEINFVKNCHDGIYDAVLVAVNHQQFVDFEVEDWRSILKNKPIFFDLKKCCRYFEADFYL